MDFAEFAVAWVISNRVNRAKSATIKHYVDSTNFGNFTTGYTEPREMSTCAWISHSSGQGSANWADFAQFAVNFESFIYHGAKQKMVCEFHIICMNCGLFGYLGGVLGFFF